MLCLSCNTENRICTPPFQQKTLWRASSQFKACYRDVMKQLREQSLAILGRVSRVDSIINNRQFSTKVKAIILPVA